MNYLNGPMNTFTSAQLLEQHKKITQEIAKTKPLIDPTGQWKDIARNWLISYKTELTQEWHSRGCDPMALL